ncbi:hypothetical protein BGW36DRAFT_407934 [Talaromyces proteolyticus]|uniref:BRCT domain-containing protein n=1 Tax=Talaromyces proteolyticus TaxID=1131652 RepID=A0AAD4KSU7_9EURO|nr:uncharacterized protein BGW36DRAFT_407934 [Talaromyces proteolyticus]KAH8695951.1 hypothetical protein BGW36DRAFT_407934 [Talaromyces proteolyticus]
MAQKANTERTLRNCQIFDPWNTSSTGHQRADNPYSNTTDWQTTRREKLARQFRGVDDGVVTVMNMYFDPAEDTHGAAGGSVEEAGGNGRGEWQWISAEEARRYERRNELGTADIRQYMGGVNKSASMCSSSTTAEMGKKVSSSSSNTAEKPPGNKQLITTTSDRTKLVYSTSAPIKAKEKRTQGIFHSLTFFINGSTYPLISDHKLRQLVAEQDGAIALSLARRSVTHVIIAMPPNSSAKCRSVGGGGLAALKLEKEIRLTKGGGKGIRFVGVEWIIESVKAGKRLPEARFAVPGENGGGKNDSGGSHGLVGASSGQRSVYGMFKVAS